MPKFEVRMDAHLAVARRCFFKKYEVEAVDEEDAKIKATELAEKDRDPANGWVEDVDADSGDSELVMDDATVEGEFEES